MATSFKAVTITGPRQSGKTTLARMTFQEKAYVSLEPPDMRRMAEEDPRRFLSRYPDGCIFDEIQRVPQLLSYLQELLDASDEPGRYILTGSRQLELMENVTQSLAGRTALLTLLPFSYAELVQTKPAGDSLESILFAGGYPPIYDLGTPPEQWLDSYISTYIERDVRLITNVRDLSLFTRFLALCAGSTGQLVNTSRLGADCGINHGTVKHWLSILEASYVVFLLQPHYRNYRKRIVKTPKLYFYDTGLAVRLLGIETPQQLLTHPLRGAIFENWVMTELLKTRFNNGKKSNLFFWRDNLGLEVDAILEEGGTLQPIEIKSGQTLSDDWFRSLSKWQALAGSDALPGKLVYGGDQHWQSHGIEVHPWQEASRCGA